MTKDNLTKYLKLYRNILSNCTFGYKFLLNFTFRQIYLTKLSFRQIGICQIVLRQEYFDRLYFSSKCPEALLEMRIFLNNTKNYALGIRKSFGSQTPLVDKKFKSNKNFDAVYATDQKTIRQNEYFFAVQKVCALVNYIFFVSINY